MQHLITIGVDVFLKKYVTKQHVGTLKKIQGKFIFAYDEKYFRAKNVIPFGPEFPLTQRTFTSKSLFLSFEDRIPSRQNPAYDEYCLSTGIDPEEKDPLILLSTIGRKGPSSFIFYPIFERVITAQNVIDFRQSLGFTTRDFSTVFELSQNSLVALEKQQRSGKEILKRFEIILKFPSVALYYLHINGGILSHDKWVKAIEKIQANKSVHLDAFDDPSDPRRVRM